MNINHISKNNKETQWLKVFIVWIYKYFLNQVILKESQGRLYWSVFTVTHAGVCGFFYSQSL